MQVKPLTEQEIRDSKYLPTSTWPFTIKSSKDNLPPGGTQTIELLLVFNRGDGRTYPIKDSLSTKNMGKLYSACLACGLADKYRMGQINAADFGQKTGYARVFLNPPRNGYPEKNVISAYVAQGLTR